tara:strand:+ start:557 stop:697 length:141 start_codon:yes stop_codon:yes gene_type:complete
MKFTTDEIELVEAAFDSYLQTLEDGKGNPFLNRMAGRLLAKMEEKV